MASEKPEGESTGIPGLNAAAPDTGANASAGVQPGESKPATADSITEVAEPATLSTTAPAAEGTETNGAAKPAVAAPEQPAAEEPAKQAPETTTTAQAAVQAASAADTTAAASSANGEAAAPKAVTEDDTEMKEAPAPAPAAAGTGEDSLATKRSASDAFGADAHLDAQAAQADKKAKTDAASEQVDQEAAAPVDVIAPAAETNGKEAEAAPPAAAKKVGRPKKQQQAKPRAPVGQTARKTRSQGPPA